MTAEAKKVEKKPVILDNEKLTKLLRDNGFEKSAIDWFLDTRGPHKDKGDSL